MMLRSNKCLKGEIVAAVAVHRLLGIINRFIAFDLKCRSATADVKDI